jgi:hypothetical protein
VPRVGYRTAKLSDSPPRFLPINELVRAIERHSRPIVRYGCATPGAGAASTHLGGCEPGSQSARIPSDRACRGARSPLPRRYQSLAPGRAALRRASNRRLPPTRRSVAPITLVRHMREFDFLDPPWPLYGASGKCFSHSSDHPFSVDFIAGRSGMVRRKLCRQSIEHPIKSRPILQIFTRLGVKELDL